MEQILGIDLEAKSTRINQNQLQAKTVTENITNRFFYIGETRLLEQCRATELPEDITITHIKHKKPEMDVKGYFYDSNGLRNWKNSYHSTDNPVNRLFFPTILVSEQAYSDLDSWHLLRNVNAHLNVNKNYENFGNQVHQLVELRSFTKNLKRILKGPNKDESKTKFEQIEDAIHSFLMEIETTHNRLFMHGRRTSIYARIIAQKLGWTEEERKFLYLATILHDLGKTLIPRCILYKEGSLSDEEYSIVQTHTTRGAQFFSNYDHPLLNQIQRVVRHHHEHWDGTGYPDGLSKQDIPISARILAVVDVFDAVTHDRVYREPMEVSKAVELIRDGRSSHFDPEIVDVFINNLSRMKRIQSGAKAVVEDV